MGAIGRRLCFITPGLSLSFLSFGVESAFSFLYFVSTVGPSSGKIFIPTVKFVLAMPPMKQPKNTQPHPNRATDDPSEAESENPRERQAPDNTNRM
jgi:hypothetical protein